MRHRWDWPGGTRAVAAAAGGALPDVAPAAQRSTALGIGAWVRGLLRTVESNSEQRSVAWRTGNMAQWLLGMRSLRRPKAANVQHTLEWTPVIATDIGKLAGHAVVVVGVQRGASRP